MDRKNIPNFGANYGIRVVSLVVTMTFIIVFFEVMPERTIWTIPTKPEEEHMLAVPESGEASLCCRCKNKKNSKPQLKNRNLRSKTMEEGEF
jgi:hypothetical protein